MVPRHVIDYDSFLSRLVAALRKTWQEVRARRSDETFYMFGIQTDSDVTDLTPFCQTHEQYRAEKGSAEARIEKWAVDQDSELYGAGSQYTSGLAGELNRYVFEDHSDEPQSAFEERRDRLLKIFERSLELLDAEGLFGTGNERRQMLLLVDIVDADEDEWQYMLGAMKRINPPGSTRELLALIDEAEEEMDSDVTGKAATEQEVIAMASGYLRDEGCSFASCRGAFQVHSGPLQILTDAEIAGLVDLLPEEPAPNALWKVFFDREPLPPDTADPSNVIAVVVDSGRRNCAIEPPQSS